MTSIDSASRASRIQAPRQPAEVAPAAAVQTGGHEHPDLAPAAAGSSERAAHGDQVQISEEGARLAEEQLAEGGQEGTEATAPEAGNLTPEESERVRELAARDREVRAHENAHKAAAGNLAVGGPTYSYERGPDGRNYAVGGEVQISLREGSTPEESIAIASRARRAALAPSEPSSQDRSVASSATQMEAQARSKMQAERAEESEVPGEVPGKTESVDDDPVVPPGVSADRAES